MPKIIDTPYECGYRTLPNFIGRCKCTNERHRVNLNEPNKFCTDNNVFPRWCPLQDGIAVLPPKMVRRKIEEE